MLQGRKYPAKDTYTAIRTRTPGAGIFAAHAQGNESN